MAVVSPSELREVIEIHEPIHFKEKGIVKYTYKKIARLRAKVKSSKTNLFYSSDTRKRNSELVFIVHKREYVNEENFIKYKDKYYRIVQVSEMSDHIYVQVFAEVVV